MSAACAACNTESQSGELRDLHPFTSANRTYRPLFSADFGASQQAFDCMQTMTAYFQYVLALWAYRLIGSEAGPFATSGLPRL